MLPVRHKVTQWRGSSWSKKTDMEATISCYAWPKDSLCYYTHPQCNRNQPTLFLCKFSASSPPSFLAKMAASALTPPAPSLLFSTVSSSKSSRFPHFLPSTRRRFSTHVFSTEILGYTFTLDDQTALLPALSPGLSQFQEAFEQLPEVQRWALAVVGGLIWVYLTARPGVLLGAIDAYLLAPVQLVLDKLTGRRSLKTTDFVVGNRLGEGSFGVVYSGALVAKDWNGEEMGRMAGRSLESDKKIKERVILKKVKVGINGAKEFADFEEWFNYRLSRAAPETCAEFLGSFVADETLSQFTKGGKWLVWKFEGDRDLADYMKERDFPLNLDSIMFGRVLKGVDSLERNALIIKQIMRQIISSLKKIHDTGIVHRDVKPANLVVTRKGKIKLIDFGAATDLRIGKNYTPNLTLLDPDYCPPELYVLPEETPSPPPEPIAAILSPILWQLNCPDLFDMYSAGITLLQMAIPSLRSTAGLKNFNLELKTVGYDLKRWRDSTRTRPDFRILDLDSGRGWDLATKLVCERGVLGRGRLSAAAALRHPYFLLGGDQAAVVLSKLTFSN